MRTRTIDRLTNTNGFRALLGIAGVFVLPVLALGLLFTPSMLVGMISLLWDRPELDGAIGFEGWLIALGYAGLSLGGAVGLTGFVLALLGSRQPERLKLTATLVCLCVGVVTALTVTGILIYSLLMILGNPWGAKGVAIVPAALAASTTVWALGGVGWMQRLSRLYAERTGLAFDSVGVALLLLALTLALAVAFGSATL